MSGPASGPEIIFEDTDMTRTDNPREIARFLRTLRVATQTALALDDLKPGRGETRPVTSFSALAAKSADEWRFPAAGLMSADGLLLAQLSDVNERSKVLALQAQGASGLSAYAGRPVRLRLGAGQVVEGVFDPDGRLEVASVGDDLSEADFCAFEIEMLDGAP